MKSESVPQQTSNSGEMGRTSTKFCGIGILNGWPIYQFSKKYSQIKSLNQRF